MWVPYYLCSHLDLKPRPHLNWSWNGLSGMRSCPTIRGLYPKQEEIYFPSPTGRCCSSRKREDHLFFRQPHSQWETIIIQPLKSHNTSNCQFLSIDSLFTAGLLTLSKRTFLFFFVVWICVWFTIRTHKLHLFLCVWFPNKLILLEKYLCICLRSTTHNTHAHT